MGSAVRRECSGLARLNFRQVIALAIAGSMFVSSTGAVAANAAVPVQQADPWATLSMLSAGAPAAAVCGSAATTAAVQPANGCVLPVIDAAPPPPAPIPGPPPPPPQSLWLALGAVG